jgi:hypothetical protein
LGWGGASPKAIPEIYSMKSEEKIVPPLVLEVIKYSNNVKLLLLSATPMFNDASEIVPLLNMLLANDDRPLIFQML